MLTLLLCVYVPKGLCVLNTFCTGIECYVSTTGLPGQFDVVGDAISNRFASLTQTFGMRSVLSQAPTSEPSGVPFKDAAVPWALWLNLSEREKEEDFLYASLEPKELFVPAVTSMWQKCKAFNFSLPWNCGYRPTPPNGRRGARPRSTPPAAERGSQQFTLGSGLPPLGWTTEFDRHIRPPLWEKGTSVLLKPLPLCSNSV